MIIFIFSLKDILTPDPKTFIDDPKPKQGPVNMTQADQPLPFQDTFYMDITRPPSMPAMYARGLWRSVFRSQGVLVHGTPTRIVGEMKGVRPVPEQVSLYRKVCGYASEGRTLPIAFPETLFIGLIGRLVTSRAFPLSPMGLIHVQQDIQQHHPIPDNSLLDLGCAMSKLVETDRGFRLEIGLDVRVDQRRAWEGTIVLLSRFRTTIQDRQSRQRKALPPMPNATLQPIDVPGDTGLRYAKASGDYNPHHLYGITARPLGYKRPIAHGMWSLARSLAEIEKTLPVAYPVSVRASFKLPIYMPAAVSLAWDRNGTDRPVAFRLTDANDHRPHLNGLLEMGNSPVSNMD